MSKHILLYTDEPGVAGVGQYNHSILCALAAAGYRVSCVQSRASNPMLSWQREIGIQHLWLNYNPLQDFWRSLQNPADAREIFSNARPDLIIFSDGCPLANFAAKQAAIQLCIPYIVVLHLIVTPEASAPSVRSYIDILPDLYTEARQLITVSSHNLSLLHKLFGLPQNKGKVIYLGRSEEYFSNKSLSNRQRLRREHNIAQNALLCLTTARLELLKGYQYQLEAIKQLEQSSVWPKLCFAWAGSGTQEVALREAVYQLGLSDKVKILGQRWDIRDWLDASDIFVLPSHLEGMPLSIIEAMAKGLPVVASAVNGIPEELGETGRLLPDPNIEPQATIRELASTLQTWAVETELRHAIGEACRKRAERLFREERMIQETVKVIEAAFLLEEDNVFLDLKGVNFIVFPDWFQSEEILSSELLSLLREIATHLDKSYITLLIYASDVSEDANMMLSGVIMNLLMEENLAIEATEVSLVGELSKDQWKALLPRIQARIVLKHEDRQAIVRAGAGNIPSCEAKNLYNLRRDRFSKHC